MVMKRLGIQVRDARRRVKGLLRWGAGEARTVGDAALSEIARHAEAGRRVVRRGVDSAWQLAVVGGQRLQAIWEPEDPATLLLESHLFRDVTPPEGAPDLQALSVAWRNEVLLALSSAGLLSLEDEIAEVLDGMFREGVDYRALGERLIARWIDAARRESGAGALGRRVARGHPLEVIPDIYREEGLEGVLLWAQQVGRDVLSRYGVPVVRGKDLAAWIESQGLAMRGRALALVSFNAVELASVLLAAAFAFRLADWVTALQRRRKVRKRCRAAQRARDAGDIDAAIANYAEALSLSEDDPLIAIALGWAYLELEKPAAESFLYFRRAGERLAVEDRLVKVQGVPVSLRGIAYLLSLVGAQKVLGGESRGVAWREELERAVRGAVRGFELAAISQLDRPSVRIGEREIAWRERPLSAAANYYLAAQTVASTPFSEAYHELGRFRDGALAALAKARSKLVEDAQRRRLDRIAVRWRAELVTAPDSAA